MDPQKKIRFYGLLLTLVLSVFCHLIRTTPSLQNFENTLVDFRYQQRTARTDPSQILLVTVDTKALEEIKVPYSLWSEFRAQAIKNLVAAGATVVAPDVLWQFDPNSILEYDLKFQTVADTLIQAEKSVALATLQGPVVLGAYFNGDKVLKPRPVLEGAAGDRLALLNLNEDSDGAVRRLKRRANLDGQDWPFFASRVAELAGSEPRDGDYWIDYRGPSESFPKLSFSDVLGDELSPELEAQVRDKIVLIGSYDARLGDQHRSPFSLNGQADMFGVEVHANAVETLLNETPLRQASSALEIVLNIGVALITALVIAELGPVKALISFLGLLVSVSLGCLFSFTHFGLWVNWTDKLLLICFVGFSVLALRYFFIERLRKKMRKAFERYVPFDVVNHIFDNENALELGGRDYEVTVLFSDITNFSTTSERVEPRELLSLVNAYFGEMTKVIYAHGGTIRQFVGDEIMVIFGAPTEMKDHARKAVETALAMERRLKELKVQNPNDQNGFYENKIGLHTGQVLCGNVGSDLRMEYTAVGDNVNLGSRIMGLNKTFDSKILLSKDTLDRAGDLSGFNIHPLGSHKVKGREGGIEIYELRL